MYVETTKVQSFKDMKNVFISSIRNMEREDIEIYHILKRYTESSRKS